MICKKYLSWSCCLLTFPLLLLSCSSSKVFRSAKRELLNDKTIHAAHIGISVFDVRSAKFIFDHQGDQYFVPASNTKIPSCYAAMKYLGDSLTAFNYVQKGRDTIVIEGTGNPDFLHPDFKEQKALKFLEQFRTVTISTQSYDDFLGSGWAWNDYTDYYMAPRSELPLYGNIVTYRSKGEGTVDIYPSYFKRLTKISRNSGDNDGFDIGKSFDTNSFTITDGSRRTAEVPFSPGIVTVKELLADTLKVNVEITKEKMSGNAAAFKSRPLDSVLAPMMHRSDNFFAEQMLLMVSQQLLGKMSDREIIDTLLKTDLASLPQKPRWVDGSGLSRYNLFTPQDFVMILDKMQSEFGIDRIKTIFPTGGEGTISSYYQEEKGQIFAKTGTLSGVVALSGYLYTKKGKLLLFSVLVNNHNGSATDVRRAVEKFLRKTRDIK
jgi:D-alanyl-D-alanine carboxypeptidase/D-alanyl-D-alanine-endopeptidase (penicillin-binding protein 4)